MRLFNGVGPEITVPDWMAAEEAPSPELWLDWFHQQSYQAQLVVVSFHLDAERRLAAVQRALASDK